MSNYSEKILITTGDPNAIGAEITIKALKKLNLPTRDIVIVSNKKVLNSCGGIDGYEIIEEDLDGRVEFGNVTAQAGDFAFRCLKRA